MKHFLLSIVFVIFAVSCSNDKEPNNNNTVKEEIKTNSVMKNANNVKAEANEIKSKTLDSQQVESVVSQTSNENNEIDSQDKTAATDSITSNTIQKTYKESAEEIAKLVINAKNRFKQDITINIREHSNKTVDLETNFTPGPIPEKNYPESFSEDLIKKAREAETLSLKNFLDEISQTKLNRRGDVLEIDLDIKGRNIRGTKEDFIKNTKLFVNLSIPSSIKSLRLNTDSVKANINNIKSEFLGELNHSNIEYINCVGKLSVMTINSKINLDDYTGELSFNFRGASTIKGNGNIYEVRTYGRRVNVDSNILELKVNDVKWDGKARKWDLNNLGKVLLQLPNKEEIPYNIIFNLNSPKVINEENPIMIDSFANLKIVNVDKKHLKAKNKSAEESDKTFDIVINTSIGGIIEGVKP